MKTCQENPNLGKIGQIYRALYMKTKVGLSFAFVVGEIKSPQNCYFRVKWYQADRITKICKYYAKLPLMVCYTCTAKLD